MDSRPNPRTLVSRAERLAGYAAASMRTGIPFDVEGMLAGPQPELLVGTAWPKRGGFRTLAHKFDRVASAASFDVAEIFGSG